MSCLDLGYDFWIVDETGEGSRSNPTSAVVQDLAQGTLGNPSAECFSKFFWQGNRAAAVKIHSNVNLRGLSAELAIADARYPVLEYR